MISLRLIPPGEIDAILLVGLPEFSGERDDILLVVTPRVDITFGSTKLDVSRDSALAFMQSASRVNEETYFSYIRQIAPHFR
jgi:hypothetical protein